MRLQWHIRHSVQGTPRHGENAAPRTLFDHFAAPGTLVRSSRFSNNSALTRRTRAAPRRPAQEIY